MDVVRAQRALEAVGSEVDERRWPFPCALLCGACGYLRLPELRAVPHPLRVDPDAAAPVSTPCPRCDHPASGTLDLAEKSLAHAVVDAERHEREHSPQSTDPVVAHTLAGLLSAGAGAAAMVTGIGLALGAAGLGYAGVALAQAWTHWRRLQHRRDRPARWCFASPPTSTAGIVEGTAHGEEIVAPLTGRRCLAYEVVVAWADGADDDALSWALVEQRVAPLQVGETHHAPDSVHLALSRQPVDATAVSDSASAKMFLRSRGLQTTDGEFLYFEAIVPPRARVRLRGDGAVVTLGLAETAVARRSSKPAGPVLSPSDER